MSPSVRSICLGHIWIVIATLDCIALEESAHVEAFLTLHVKLVVRHGAGMTAQR